MARLVARAGVRRIDGSVAGSTGYFQRDWWATGWRSNFPRDEIPLATALAFEGNVARGRHIGDPERRAAKALTHKLRAQGVNVVGRATAGAPPAGLVTVAQVRSVPLGRMLRFTNRRSANFFAEMLGKKLGVTARGTGSIAAGAAATESWAAKQGASVSAYDASGLSYSNRISPDTMTWLLDVAASRPWAEDLRLSLPSGGQGTLEDRLHGVPLRAKTGTLSGISTLSGYVRLRRSDARVSFSIMSSGTYKATAAALEDDVVRLLVRSARVQAVTTRG